ncbi:TRAP transporter large permease [Virgibacillus sediminis]|uniref:TRAP transporter large permease n=1 Tax=Virgibacillus sediminis TaxID=202260 RepID=A0ABV7A5B2_9BACI
MLFTLLMLFGLFFLLIATNMPVAIALGISSLAVLLVNNMATIDMYLTASFTASDSLPLIAIPLFILAGDIMSKGGIAKRLIQFVETLVGSFTGGLGIITVITSFIFAAISGSGPATVAVIGGIMLPYMIERGYSKEYSTSLVASAGSMGPIIPPSILFILYGVLANVSIGDLFIAGIIPGMMIGLTLIIVNYFISKKENYTGTEKKTFNDVVKSLNEAKFALLAPIVVLGGIYGGVFTPTEAAVIAVFYSLLVSLFIHKEINFKDIPSIFMNASAVSGGIMILVGVAALFGRILSLEQIPNQLSQFIAGITTNPFIMLLVISVFLLIVGMFMETVSALMIFVPILIPIALHLGVDPLHFGIIASINLTLGQLTPPMGINLFVASRISDLPFERTFKYLFPILGALIITMLIITYIPQLSLFLPELLN